MDIANLIIRVTNEGLDRATRELRRLQDNAQGAQAANKKFGESIADLNKLAMVGFGALTAVVGGSIKTAIDFEKAMAGVAKTVDFATDNGLANMKKGIEDLTKTIPLAFEELAEIAAVGGQLGVAEQDILGFTETIAKMGVAFDVPAEQAADSMAKIANGFKIPIAEIGTLGDTINAVSNSMAATAGDVINFMGRVSGSSAALKISADNVAALGGAMAALNMQPEIAATAFNSLSVTLAKFDNLSKSQKSGFAKLGLDTKEFAETIKTDGLGAIMQVLEASRELGGTDAIAALNLAFGESGTKLATMAEGMDTVKFALDQVGVGADGVSKTLGSMEAEFESVSSTTANKLELTKNNMRLVAAAVGEAFLPAVNDLVESLVPLIEKVNEWAKANPELIVQIAKVVAAVTGAIIAMAAISGAIGTVISTFQGLSAIFGVAKAAVLILGGALSLPILIIGALIAIGVALYLNWDTIKEKAAELWQSVVAAWDGLVAGTSAAWDGIKASISGAWDGIVEYTSSAWSSLTSTISAAWESIKSVISAGWEAIVYAFQNPMETIKSILSLLWEAFKTGAVAVFTALVEIFVGGGIELYKSVVKLKDDAIQAFINLKDGAIQALINLKDLAIQAVVAIKDGIILGFNAAIDGALFIWEAFKNGVSAVFNGIKAIIQAGMDAIKWLFDGGWLVILNAVKNTLTTMVSVAKTAVKNLATAIFDGMVTAKNYVVTKVGEILTFFRELPSKMFNLGVDFIKGFANGIKSMASSVWDAAKDVAKGASNIVQKTIDSHSPSKVTTKLGKDFSKGMENGIKKGAKAVKTEAQKIAEGAVKAVQDGVANLKREIALFGNDSPVAALKYDISVGKFGGADTSQLMSLTQTREQLELSKKLADANKSVQDSIDGLIKQQALFGNNSSLASLMYDIEHTEKYKNITQELKDELIAQTKAFEQLGMTAKATQAIQERFAKLKTDQEASGKAVDGVMGELQAETAIGKIQADYERRIEVIRKHEELTTGLIGSEEAKRLAIYESAQKAKELIQIQGNEKLFGELSSITSKFFGEQSAAHKAMFLVEKYFALKRILVENQVALSKAWASASFPYNLPAVATVAAQTGLLAAAVKGFKQGGYTGNMGASQVAGVVHGQEYVFDAQATKRIGVDNLNAMRSGKSVGGGDVNISVNVDAKGNSSVQGDNERMGRDMANGIKAVVMDVMRKEKRQGGMLYA